MVNNAVNMASEGANLVMLGKMGMASDIDGLSINHGKQMMSNAKALINKIMKGDAMKNLHKAGEGKTHLTPNTPPPPLNPAQ